MANDKLDLLERAVHEIQALSIIYNDDTSEQSTSFTILSKEEYQQAQSLLDDPPAMSYDLVTLDVPTLRAEIDLQVTSHDAIIRIHQCKVHFTLVPGYPDMSAIVSVVSIGNLNRSQRDEFGRILNDKAGELVGSEALMELIQDVQDTAVGYLSTSKEDNPDVDEDNDNDKDNDIDEETSMLSRRWIWVHHITNNNRCKDIVQEAKERSLRGYLKAGYPGIVVVEGESKSCDEYVQWIKGNKSRPGGFGRNWGHHVRGELMIQNDVNGAFTNEFEDVGGDLSVFASRCREAGVEDEFKLYVMQH